MAPVPVWGQALSDEQVAAIRQGAETVIVPDPPVDVPLVGAPTLPLVDVRLNGSGPYRMLVDLGANVTILRRDVVDRAGLEVVVERATTDIVRADSLTIGSAVYYHVWMGAYGELDVDGVVGWNLLSKLPFTLDYPGQRLRLGIAQVSEDDPEFVEVGRLPYLPARIGDREVLLNLDTGATESMTVPAEWAGWLPLAEGPRPGPTVYNEQTGAVETQVARLAVDVVVGDVVIPRPQVHLNPDVEDAWLGSGFLRDYVVAVDPRIRRVRLTARGP